MATWAEKQLRKHQLTKLIKEVRNSPEYKAIVREEHEKAAMKDMLISA